MSWPVGDTMNQTTGASSPLRMVLRPPALAVAAIVGVLMAATLALWAHYGTVVFYETILTGIAACF